MNNTNKTSKKGMLIILDGWGHGQKKSSDALAQANTPFIDKLHLEYPNAELVTFGKRVGLPEGQMGNSEVGHLNIGAGRIVYQDLEKINQALEKKELENNEVLNKACSFADNGDRNVHLFGLLSDGGVHSHIDHLKGMCDILLEKGLKKIYLHCFLDGRDTDPNRGLQYLIEIEEHIQKSPIKIASVIGRYYAMDRDHRWERIKLAYDLMVKGEGIQTRDLNAIISQKYSEGITDEFMDAICLIDETFKPVATIGENDLVISYNFRTDRPRQITRALTQEDFKDYGMQKLNLYFVSMTRYDKAFKGLHVLFDKDVLRNTMGEHLSSMGLSQLRAAETEKYPHVTFFFSGGREEAFEGEERILVNSPKVATYDLQPEMSAYELTDKVIDFIDHEVPDFVCLNYANADMVGHTGVFEAGMKAAEAVDFCVSRLVEAALAKAYEIIIIADHGNADYMINEDGSANTAHSMNPVPIIYVSNDPVSRNIENGILADVSPTLLRLMQLEQPADMTGKSLIS
jgi:2,3-bisphosphoglycerate-independent phosphoglycerate mutase